MGKKSLLLVTLVLLLISLCSCEMSDEKPPGMLPGNVIGQLDIPQLKDNAAPNDPNEASFKFAVLGDSKILPDCPQWQGNAILSELVQDINKSNPDFTIYLGDGPDQGGPISNIYSFREILSKMRSPWYPAIGNHEILRGASSDGKSGDGEDNYLEVFSDKLPVKDSYGNKVSYYSFDYLNSHFIVLDTAWQNRDDGKKKRLYPGSEQWEWLVRDLEPLRSKSKHIFIFGHEPPLISLNCDGKAHHESLSSAYSTSWSSAEAANSFERLCYQYHIDFVFSGHFHAYCNFRDGDITHVITGGAGASLYAPPESGGYYHYVLCSVKGAKISYDVKRLN